MIAFVQPYGLEDHGGGARILRSLLTDAPVPYVVIDTSPVSKNGETALGDLRLPRRPAAGRLESTRLAPLLALGDTLMASRFRDRLVATLREVGATAVHAIPHGPEFWHAFEAARELGIPYALYVHDDLPYNLPGVPYLSWAMDRLGDAWRGADVRYVISDAMGEELNARHGSRPYAVVTDGLPRVADAPRPLRENRLRTYLMGSIHLSYEQNFDELFRALKSIQNAGPSLDVSLVTRGGFPFPVRNLGIPVESRPWGSQADIDADLEDVDLLYLPLPFDPRHASFARYSLATKLVTYAGTGIPILMHGPADSAAARLLEAHGAAIMATKLEGASVADAIVVNWDRAASLAANALEMARSRFLLADQRSSFWGGLLPLASRVPSPPAPRRRRRRETIA